MASKLYPFLYVLLAVVLILLSQNGEIVAATVTPEVITVNKSVQVTVVAEVKPFVLVPPALKATLVESIGYDKFGGSRSTLGWLRVQKRDSRGDYVYSGTYTIGHDAAETVQIQVKNVLGFLLSFGPTTTTPPELAVSPTPYTLPPDPGDAGRTSLQGIDSDHDGIRDDVEREIFFLAPGSERVRAALTQYAVVEQQYTSKLIPSHNDAQTLVADQFDAADCVRAMLGYESSRSDVAVSPILDVLRHTIVNTDARKEVERQNDRTAGSYIYTAPSTLTAELAKCTFTYSNFSD